MPREKPQSSLTWEKSKKPPQDRRVALVTTQMDGHYNPMRLTSNGINRLWDGELGNKVTEHLTLDRCTDHFTQARYIYQGFY